MSEPILRAAAIFCGLGMGVWPTAQRCGCCCVSPAEVDELLCDAQQREYARDAVLRVDIPPPIKMFEAVPTFAIKNFTDDYRYVDAVFTSVFQQTRPGASTLWEVVENIPPAGVPKHVLFCTMLD